MSKALQTGVINAGPFSDGTNNSTELRFTSAVGALSNNLPLDWRGKMVEILNESAAAAEFVAVLFSYADDAETATLGAAAADGGPAAGRGRVILAGQLRRFRVPAARRHSEAVQFSRIAASGTPAISLALVE